MRSDLHFVHCRNFRRWVLDTPSLLTGSVNIGDSKVGGPQLMSNAKAKKLSSTASLIRSMGILAEDMLDSPWA